MDKEHEIHHGADYFTDLGREVLQRLFEQRKRDKALSDKELRIQEEERMQSLEEAEVVGEYPPLLSSIPGRISAEVNGGPIKSREDLSRVIRGNPHVKSLIIEHHKQGRNLWVHWDSSNKLKLTIVSAAAAMVGVVGAGVYIRKKHHKK